LVQALPLAGLWGPPGGLFALVLLTAISATYIVLLVRFGLLASLAAFLFGGLSSLAVYSLDSSSPLFGVGLFLTAVALALAAYGGQVSMAGRPLLQDSLLRG
jgi:hypothetical protein